MQKNRDCEKIILFFYSILLQAVLSNAASDLLFFATPGGRGFTAGFYGGEIDLKHGAYPRNRFRIGYDCMDVDSGNLEDIMIKSVSLDMKSGSVILHIGSVMDSSKVTLLRVPLCKRLAHQSCDETTSLKPVFLNIQITSHNIVSFASYGDQIYFISEKEEKDFATNKKYSIIELRNLTGCGGRMKMPYGANSVFYVESCSTLIATLPQKNYDDSAQYHTTSGLAIVPTANGPVFYTQIQRFLPEQDKINPDLLTNAFILTRVTPDGRVDLLHEEFVTAEHKRYIIEGLGQITYRGGLLCWTALDRIACAMVDNRGTINHARIVMQSGEASEICAASPNEPFLSTVTTGVAIARVPQDITRDEIALYFGCIAQTRALGGSGLVRKKGDQRSRVQLLRSNLTTIYAGSMLITDICSREDIDPLSLLNNGVQLNSCFLFHMLILCFAKFFSL